MSPERDAIDPTFLDALELYERRIFWKDQLINISKSLSSTLDINRLIESMMHSCLTMAQISQVGMLVSDAADSHNMTLHPASLNLEDNPRDRISIPERSGFTKMLIAENINVIQISELQKHAKDHNVETSALNKLDALSPGLSIMPLRNKDKIVGILLLGAKVTGENLGEDEKQFLTTLGAIAASAVVNARLYELATTDMMTKLKIHHFFQNQLREEMEDAIESKNPLCIIISDIDNFKTFNDTYGHQLGDVVLKQVAGKILGLSRPRDISARYGGEEFVVILPNTDLEAAYSVAERIRASVASIDIADPNNSREILSVTISLGVAQFNSEIDSNNHDIIERCDKALYKAKENGRNRTEIAENIVSGRQNEKTKSIRQPTKKPSKQTKNEKTKKILKPKKKKNKK